MGNVNSKFHISVSLIVPVYNGEALLRRCLDSIYSQDYSGLEIILVDDGSTDSSGTIYDEYALMHPDIHTIVVHKEHSGLMRSRYAGIQKASSEYIAFVDADDYIEKNHISSMVNNLDGLEADTVVEGCILHEGEKCRFLDNRIEAGRYKKDEILKQVFPKMLYFGGYFDFGILPFMWNKLFKRELLEGCYKKLDQSVYDGEDVLAFFSYMLSVSNMVIGNEHTYHYCLTQSSMTKNIKPDFLENVSKLYLNLNSLFSKNSSYKVLGPQLDQYMRMMVKKSKPESYIADELYFFPCSKIPAGSRTVIYGAGLAGKSYVHQLNKTGYCYIEAWLDKNFMNLQPFEDVIISAPETIEHLLYDYVIIAIADEAVANKIKEYLISEFKINEDIIII